MVLLRAAIQLLLAEAVIAQTIFSIKPRGGPVKGGTIVTVEGKGLDSVTQCMFGEERVPLSVDGDNPTIATCVSPEISVGELEAPKDFRVTTKGSPIVEEASPFKFQYYINPHVDSITPTTTRLAGGGIVVAEGTGFDAFENGSPAAKCKFGTLIGNVTAITDYGRNLECTVPPGVAVGNVKFSVALNGQNFVSGSDEAKILQYLPNPAPTGFREPTPLPATPVPTEPPTPPPTVAPTVAPAVIIPSPAPSPLPLTLKMIAQTSIIGSTQPGSRILKVNSTEGFLEAHAVRVNPGMPNQEDIRVLGAKDGNTLVVDKPLLYAHSLKEPVFCYVSIGAKPHISVENVIPASMEQAGSQAEVAYNIKMFQPSTMAAAVFCLMVITMGVTLVVGFAVNRMKGRTGLNAVPFFSTVREAYMTEEVEPLVPKYEKRTDLA